MFNFASNNLIIIFANEIQSDNPSHPLEHFLNPLDVTYPSGKGPIESVSGKTRKVIQQTECLSNHIVFYCQFKEV